MYNLKIIKTSELYYILNLNAISDLIIIINHVITATCHYSLQYYKYCRQ